jgi:pimeloyl-ACP methyl ester carboxylesterase
MTTTSGPAVRRARLSAAPLPPVDHTIPPWPGEPVRVAGTEVYVRHTPGRAGAGEPALYLHGLGGASTNWTDLAALLAGHLDADAPDLPGFGRSGPPPRRNYSLDAQARLVAELIERRGRGPVHLLGNSMGGAISVLVAATRPDLVSTLTLVSPAMPDLRPRRGSDAVLPLLLLPGLDRLVGRRLTRMAPEARVRALLALCYADPTRVPPNRLAEAAAEVRLRNEMPWATDALARAFRGLIGGYLARGPRSLWRLAARITAPTLVVWGAEDRLVDVALARRTALAIPDSRLLVLARIGHTAQLEDPETVARAVLGLLEDRG